MAENIKDVVLEGSGPFAIPLLSRAVSLDNAGHPEFALIRCEFEDGPTVYVPIANQTVAGLIDLLSFHQQKLAERGGNGSGH